MTSLFPPIWDDFDCGVVRRGARPVVTYPRFLILYEEGLSPRIEVLGYEKFSYASRLGFRPSHEWGGAMSPGIKDDTYTWMSLYKKNL